MQGISAVTGTQAAELLERAMEAYKRARRNEALELLAGCAEWPAPYNEQGMLLRADALTAHDAIGGLQELAAHADVFTTHDGRLGYLIASARAYMRARNFDAAEAMLDTAYAEIDGENTPRRQQLAFARARLQWNRREYDPHSEELAIAVRASDPALRFDAINLRGWMHAGLEDYRSQMSDFLECINLYETHGYLCGMASVVQCLQSLLVLAWEMHENDAVKVAEAAFDTVQWTPEIRVHRFLCLRALAWHAFLAGDSARAQWLFKDSKDDAPTPAWKVMAHADRAYVARINLNEPWAAEELHEAHVLARSVEWHSTRDEERQALVTMALLFAPMDLGHAQRYVSTYIELGTNNLNPNLEASHEPRRSIAHQKYAAGRVQAVLGNTALAIRSLEGAYEIFAHIEHHFRAALAAQALHELTGNDRWLENARAHAAKFPNSALAQSLSRHTAGAKHAEIDGLTASQRQIAIAHCQGAGNEELSQRFSRSTFTIEKQLQAIYEILGAKNRSGLREELHRRGLL